MKRGGPDHPKVFALAEALKIRRPAAIGYLEMLFHFTAQYCPQGDVGRYEAKRIAAAMDWCGKPETLIGALVATGWLDRDSRAGLVVHEWSKHADRTTLQRLSRDGKSPIVADHVFTGELCTQSETKTRTPPEPVPEPVPVRVPQKRLRASPRAPAQLEELLPDWIDGDARQRIWLGCYEAASDCTAEEVAAAVTQKCRELGERASNALLITTVSGMFKPFRDRLRRESQKREADAAAEREEQRRELARIAADESRPAAERAFASELLEGAA